MKSSLYQMGRTLALSVMLSHLFANPLAAEAPADVKNSCPGLLQHDITMLESSKPQSLCQYKGKTLLVVNTASGCGFTPQLKGLESLFQQYRDQGLVVIGFPSNSFFQESLEGEEIAEFCQLKYGVSFPITEKTAVKGADAHPFFKSLEASTGQAPEWNFFKYLINSEGEVVQVFPSDVKPESELLTNAIKKALE